jgi:hypothetical protein
MDLEKESNPSESILQRWQEMSRLRRRLLIAAIVSLDAILGLLYQSGIGNGIDALLFGNLPNDMVWLGQSCSTHLNGLLAREDRLRRRSALASSEWR